MRALIATYLATVISGCTATRYTPSLDRAFTVTGSQFLQSRSLTNATPGSSSDRCEGLPPPGGNPAGSIAVLRNRLLTIPGHGFQCFEPMLYVLTLGIIPSDCRHDYEFEALIDDHAPPARLEYSATTIQGWIAVPLSLFPGWEFSVVPPRDHCLRALRTAVNRMAESEHPPGVASDRAVQPTRAAEPNETRAAERQR